MSNQPIVVVKEEVVHVVEAAVQGPPGPQGPAGPAGDANLHPVAASGDYGELENKPALGTASPLDVPASGDAASSELVKGDDSRLTDTRSPTPHTHTAADIDSGAATDGQVLTADGAGNAAWETPAGGGMSDLVDDTTPQLGGDLDLNGNTLSDATLTTPPTISVKEQGLRVTDNAGTKWFDLYHRTDIADFQTNARYITLRANTGAQLAWDGGANQLFGPASMGIGATSARIGKFYGQDFIELKQISTPSSPATDCGRIYAKDVSGTAELFVMDEAGNETQISPHASGAPSWFYDLGEKLDHVYYSANYYAGRIEWTNETRKANLMQRQLLGEDLSALTTEEKTFHLVETFAEYNTRMGYTEGDSGCMCPRDWQTDQDAKQADYDANRQSVIDANAALPEGEQTQDVPPATDIRKPAPAFLS